MSVILLVDDDVDFVAITKHLLEQGGYEVLACHSPEQARQVLQDRPVDLVISDLMMNAMDAGFSLAAWIKAQPALARVPVVIATSASSHSGFDFHPRSAEDLQAMHADAFFDKPLRAGQVLDTIQRLLSPLSGSSS